MKREESTLFRRLLSAIIIILFTSLHPISDAEAQSRYFPDKEWQRKSPGEMGMNTALIDSAVSYALANENGVERDLNIAILKSFGHEPYFRIAGPVRRRGGPSGVVIKDGYIVAEWGDISRTDMTFSVAKSFLTTVGGLALDDGLINNIDDHVKDYVWDGKFDSEHNSKIRWRHLMNQTSDWSGELFDMYDWADRPPRRGGIDEWSRRELHEPGTRYVYNDIRVNLLAYSLLNVYRRPLPMVLKERIMDPIGASQNWRWYGYDNSWVNIDGIMMQSVSGGAHFGGGLFISTEDQARFGLLFLRNGEWDGTQLISREWVESVSKTTDVSPNYGFMWWTNSRGTWRGVPETVYYASGFGGNYIVVDNENDIVVVARWMNGRAIGPFMRMVIEAIGAR